MGNIETKEEKTIPYDSPEAAEYREATIKEGWVSKIGHYWGKDEHMARYDGCTHVRCECGVLVPKHGICKDCQEKKEKISYESFDRVKWDGIIPLNIFRSDIYFFDEDQLRDFCYNDAIDPQSLRLVLCEKFEPAALEPEDFLCDYFPDDWEGELSEDIKDAARAFNEAVEKDFPHSWTATDMAVSVSLTLSKVMK